MLDLKFIKANVDKVKKAADLKGFKINLDKVLELDKIRLELIEENENARNKRNVLSEQIGKLKKEKKDATSVLDEMKPISLKVKETTKELNEIQSEMDALLLTIPNIPHSSVPIGKSAAENVPIKHWGDTPEVSFKIQPHHEIAKDLDIIDLARGAKIAGAGFPVYKRGGAKLERALINFFLDTLSEQFEYEEVWPPLVVNEASAISTGQLPDKEDLMYVAERDGLYLIPTSEVPVTNLYRNEILKEENLPIYHCSYTANFRREAGSYGKDVKGINRVHQFDKVEMVKFVKPETSYDELEKLTANAEYLLQQLKLPYRVLLMCTGDMGFTQTKKYDIEVWAPGQEKWLEVSSCSNMEAFQARRAKIRYRNKDTNKPEFVHTLNGSGLALPRVVVAILENYQTEDGKIKVPEVLKSYMKNKEYID